MNGVRRRGRYGRRAIDDVEKVRRLTGMGWVFKAGGQMVAVNQKMGREAGRWKPESLYGEKWKGSAFGGI